MCQSPATSAVSRPWPLSEQSTPVRTVSGAPLFAVRIPVVSKIWICVGMRGQNSMITFSIRLAGTRSGGSPRRSSWLIPAVPFSATTPFPHTVFGSTLSRARSGSDSATLLGRLAVSSAARGRRLGRLHLMDALHESWRNTAEVASVGLVVDARWMTAVPSTCITSLYRCLITPTGCSLPWPPLKKRTCRNEGVAVFPDAWPRH
jgi:hypothetical protein